MNRPAAAAPPSIVVRGLGSARLASSIVRRRAVACAALAACLTAAGCGESLRTASPAPTARSPSEPPAAVNATALPSRSAGEPVDGAALLAAVRAREDEVRTLRAIFLAVTRKGNEGLKRVDGVLLVRKPDAFRMRLSMALGITIYDYLSRSDGVHVVNTLAAAPSRAGTDDPMPFSQHDLEELFLRGEHAFPGRCAAESTAGRLATFACTDAEGSVLRRLEIDPRNGRIERERSYHDRELLMTLESSDYRSTPIASSPQASAELPYLMVVTYPSSDLSVEIRVQKYEVDPVLDDRYFEPAS